jgi:hypothetical protein
MFFVAAGIAGGHASGSDVFLKVVTTVHLTETFMGDRREQATDSRGVPGSFARAMKALEGTCAHCSQRAIVSNGSGVGLCAEHRQMRVDSIAIRDRIKRQIEIARALDA